MQLYEKIPEGTKWTLMIYFDDKKWGKRVLTWEEKSKRVTEYIFEMMEKLIKKELGPEWQEDFKSFPAYQGLVMTLVNTLFTDEWFEKLVKENEYLKHFTAELSIGK
jgi:hypothetical protein